MATTYVHRTDTAKVNQKSVSVATVLTYSDTGKTILLAAAGKAITLPAPLSGIKYKFVSTVAITTAAWVITATGTLLRGSVTEAGLVQLVGGKTSISIIHTKSIAGDWVTLESDGTSWFVAGQLSVAASLTSA